MAPPGDRVVSPPPVAVLGSVNLDLMVWAPRAPASGELVFGDDFQLAVGGKGVNVASQLLRSGAFPLLLGCIGADQLGGIARDGIESLGLSTELLRQVAGHTGVGHVHVDADGEYRSIVVPGANARSSAIGQELAEILVPCAATVVQFEAAPQARAQLLTGALPHDSTLYLNPSPWTATPDEELAGADVLVCNEVEARLCARQLVPKAADRALEELGAALADVVTEVVITRGRQGASAWRVDGAHASHGGFAVEAVGTIGAGDAFLGEYVLARTERAALREALARACAAGALATLEPGPSAAQASRGRIDELVAGMWSTDG